jgi:hypothetical protein
MRSRIARGQRAKPRYVLILSPTTIATDDDDDDIATVVRLYH